MSEIKAGFAFCGSFCTLQQAVQQMESLVKRGVEIYPIMSAAAAETDTRFGTAQEWIERIESAAGRPVIRTITQAEPIGPQRLLDILIIAPCTGNTLAKLANGIADTPVTLAAKAHLRNERPVLLAVSTNDALAAAGQNIGALLNRKQFYFVPMRQDAPQAKPRSVVADFSRLFDAMQAALRGEQLQPLLL
ncbi:MAG: dipicolinate synthase subunit B [Clostridia bacterium]|nr:dipicolinate synthase subunit B [Clostridia bacterium]